MQNGPRLFAYATWTLMISLAVIVFTSSFLVYINDPGWIGLAALLGFGLIYLNFSYFVIKRFIRKVAGETILHYILAALIFIPPAIWLLFINEGVGRSRYITIITLAFAAGLGAYYGNRTGSRERELLIDKLNENEGTGSSDKFPQ